MPHIFVTGQPGCGKSTLIQRVLQQLSAANVDIRAATRGFYTEEVRVGGERVGFDVVTVGPSPQRGVLSRAGAGIKGPSVGKYAVDLPSFEALALPQLAPQPGVRLYVVDEIGKMELLSPRFFPAVSALLDAAPLVIGTVPVARYGRSIPQVDAVKACPDVEILTVTRENRDQLARQVFQRVKEQLDSAAIAAVAGGGSSGGCSRAATEGAAGGPAGGKAAADSAHTRV